MGTTDQSFLLARWLAQDEDFKGIGPATARKLAEAFGANLHSVLTAGDPTALIGIIHVDLARGLLDVYHRKIAEAEVINWLEPRGFDTRLAFKVVAVWGERSPERLIKNPYLMLAFADWEHVDAVARAMGIDHADDRRLVAAVEAVLYRRLEQKHTLTPREQATRAVRLLLRSQEAVSRRAVEVAIADRAVLQDSDGLQPVGAAAMERYVAERIRSLQRSPVHPTLSCGSLSVQELNTLLAEFELQEGLSLSTEQTDAVRVAVCKPVSVLTGGAGVGKTTVLKAVFFVLERLGYQVQAIALAGRAAKRISEVTGRRALTIAAFLCAIKSGHLRLISDSLVVIDEASMLDLPTVYRFLRVIPEYVRLLFVGDPYQLPPIGFGLTFHLWAGRLPTVSLNLVYRQSSDSAIPIVARAIREGRLPFLDPYCGQRDGVSFVEKPAAQILGSLPAIASSLGPDAQIISPLRRGVAGVEIINGYFHGLLEPGRPSVAAGRISEGEPVIWTKNDWPRGFLNGSLGRVVAVDAERNTANVELDGHLVELEPADWQRLDLASAITVHKTQGSQFDRVVIPVTHSQLLDRNLLYTAVTRGVRQVVFIGDRQAFEKAILAPPSSHQREVGSVLRLDTSI